MPKQPKKTLQETLLNEPSNNDNPDEYIQNILSQLGESQATLQLCRANNEGKFCYVDDLDPDNFSLKTIKDVYGGGRYKITIIDSGHKFIGRSKDFYIEGLSKTIDEEETFNMEDQEITIPELSILKREVRELKNLVSALLTQNQINVPEKDNEDVFLDKLLKYKQLFTSNTHNLTDNLDVLTGIFTKSLDFANRLSGPQEETPFTLLRDFLPTISEWVSGYLDSKKLAELNKLPDDQKMNKSDISKVIDLGFKGLLCNAIKKGMKISEICKFINEKASTLEKQRINEIILTKDPVGYLVKLINDNNDSTRIYLADLIEALKKDLT